MPPFELVHLDPLKVPETLRRCYLKQVTGYMILDRSVEYLEVMEWNEDRKIEWVFVLFFIEMKQKKELAERMVALHTRYEPIEDLRYGIRLLLARDEPKEELTVLNEAALYIFREKDAEKLLKVANGILCSRHAALGILLSQRLITTLPIKEANSLLGQLLEARDKLNLTPDDPFADVLEKRLAEETHDEGKDATELRSARKRMEAKAEEVRQLKEEIERQRRALKSREKQQAAETPATTNGKVDEADVQEMRIKLSQLKATLHERAEERTGLRRALEKAHEDLQNLRHAAPANTAPAHDAAQEDEAEHYLPEQPAGNQPLRLVEFPAKFREALEDFPRHVARAALAMIGRLAGGEPAAFVGVVQLKAVHGVLRQRIGSEHRLLFRLHADRVQVLDLICRRDLDKRIKTLRFGG